jgi:hypothetical protein
VFSKNIGPPIHVAVMAHHWPIFWLWRSTTKGCLRLILLQCLLFCALIYSLSWSQASSLKNVSSGSRISPCTAQKKVSCKNVFFSSNPPSSKLEPMLIYMAVDVSILFTVFIVLERCSWMHSFQKFKITDEGGTQTPVHLQQNLLLHNLWDIFFT